MERHSDTVLVTGAAGFIGSHLVEHLLRRGDTVIGLDNFDPFYDPRVKRRNLEAASSDPRFRLIEADCADLDQVEQVLGDTPIDVIVHLAAKAGVRPSLLDPFGYTRANVVGTQVMLEYARRRGIRRFVFGSSSSVYGDRSQVPFREDDPADRPISPYAATKRAGEVICHTYHHLYGIGIAALRFFTVYGPRQRPDLAIHKFTALMARGQPIPVFGDGTTERDYTWIDDIVAGVIAAIDRSATTSDFQIFNLGESQTTSLNRLIELIAAALGVTPRIESHPMQPGDVRRTCADVSKAASLLGYRPTMPVEEGIPRFVRWWLEHYDH